MNYKNFVEFWRQGNDKWDVYKMEIGSLALKICNYFASQMELKSDEKEKYLKIFPLSETDSDKIHRTNYSSYSCVDFVSSGWAKVGLAFLLEYGESAWPKKQFVFTISIKKMKNSWIVKIADDGKVHELSTTTDDNEMESLWEEFIELFKHQTVKQFDNWLNTDDVK